MAMVRAAAWPVVFLLLAPGAALAATTQPAQPYIETVVRWQPGDETASTHRLDDQGRGSVSSDVGFRVVGEVVCSDRAVYSLQIILDNPDMPSWAGASLEPEDDRRVEFALEQGRHADTPYRYKPGPNLGIVWDLEEAPHGATYTYHAVVEHARLAPESTECTPALSTRDQLHHTANLTALGPDAAPPDEQTDGTGTPTGSSPTLVPTTILLVALLVVASRRR